jgi:hypothetical protein
MGLSFFSGVPGFSIGGKNRGEVSGLTGDKSAAAMISLTARRP